MSIQCAINVYSMCIQYPILTIFYVSDANDSYSLTSSHTPNLEMLSHLKKCRQFVPPTTFGLNKVSKKKTFFDLLSYWDWLLRVVESWTFRGLNNSSKRSHEFLRVNVTQRRIPNQQLSVDCENTLPCWTSP